jgi:hypothetical protein
MNTSPDHPDFTALALGEHIHGTPAQAVLEALRTSVAARVEAEQIQLTARQLAFALKGQPPQRLDAARRNSVLTADPAAVRARFEEEELAAFETEPLVSAARSRPGWVYPTLAAAAVAAAAFVALRLLPGYTPPSQRGGDPVTEVAPAGSGVINVTPQKTPRTRVPDPVRTPTSVAVTQEPAPQPPKSSELPSPAGPAEFIREVPPQFPVLPGAHGPSSENYAAPPSLENPVPSNSGEAQKRDSSRGKKPR